MSDQTDKPASSKPSKDRYVKIGFVVVLLVAGTVIWLSQRRDPKLSGWLTDLEEGLGQARSRNTRALVLFTASPMSYDGKRLVRQTLSRRDIRGELDRLGYVKVQLNTRKHAALASKYAVTTTPDLLLLDAQGEVIRRQPGFMNETSLWHLLATSEERKAAQQPAGQ